MTRLGGAYDTVPEVCMLLAIFEHSDKFVPIIFDEAGSCVSLKQLRIYPHNMVI